MSAEIRQLKDWTKERVIYPVTRLEAVYDGSKRRLDDILGESVISEKVEDVPDSVFEKINEAMNGVVS